MAKIVSIILGGGRGQRLYPLTAKRAKPAVPFGGKFRLVDIPISNCIHAGLREIYILTQFNSASLHRHMNNTYRFDSFDKGFVEVLAAEQTLKSSDWYQGTADAVRKNFVHFADQSPHPLSHSLRRPVVPHGPYGNVQGPYRVGRGRHNRREAGGTGQGIGVWGY